MSFSEEGMQLLTIKNKKIKHNNSEIYGGLGFMNHFTSVMSYDIVKQESPSPFGRRGNWGSRAQFLGPR